jgi:hypothetical protein
MICLFHSSLSLPQSSPLLGMTRGGALPWVRGDWDGRGRCASSAERNLSIRITKPNERVKSKFVIPTEANPDFLPRYAGHGRVCGFPYRKPHEGRQRHKRQQEIRGSVAEGSAVRLGWLPKLWVRTHALKAD